MATYEYQNDDGDSFEIVLPMADEKPEAIRVLKSGKWRPCKRETPGSYKRVFTYAGMTKAPPAGIVSDGLPISRALPARYRKKGDGSEIVTISGKKAVRHKDGTLTDLGGRRVIRNREDRARAQDQTGFKYERDV